MQVSLTSLFDAPAERVWNEVRKPATLEHVAHPLLQFEPTDPPSFPEQWNQGSYQVRQYLFGVIPLGTQTIRISILKRDATPGDQLYQIRDDGSGTFVSTWDHVVTIRETPDGKTVYTDDVTIDAGVFTIFVWLFAHVFYRYRRYRWGNWSRTILIIHKSLRDADHRIACVHRPG